jgi:hypothetical protein
MTKTSFSATLTFAAMALATANLAYAGESPSGRWLVTADLHGTPIYGPLEIEQQGQKITGQFFGDKLEGTVDGSAIHFV